MSIYFHLGAFQNPLATFVQLKLIKLLDKSCRKVVQIFHFSFENWIGYSWATFVVTWQFLWTLGNVLLKPIGNPALIIKYRMVVGLSV